MKIHPRSIITVILTCVLCLTIVLVDLSQRTDVQTTLKLSQYSELSLLLQNVNMQTHTHFVSQKSKGQPRHVLDKQINETKLRVLVENKSGFEKLKASDSKRKQPMEVKQSLVLDTGNKNSTRVRGTSKNETLLHKNIRPDTCNGCFLHNYKLVINNDVCDERADKSNVTFIILIFSKLNSVKRRTAIRETWASYSKNNTGVIRYAFLFGDQGSSMRNRKLSEENDVYRDVIQEDFVDNYQNLTLKAIMAFKWASKFCSNAKYFMKTDDDTWVNMPRLMTLMPRANLTASMIGMCAYYNTGPIRDKRYTKWYVPVERYPHNVYPQYCAGSGYVTSIDVARKIYAISKDIPFFEMEDVYVGLCLHAMGIRRRHVKGFESYHIKFKPCLYNSDKMYTNHYITPDLMYRAWNERCSAHEPRKAVAPNSVK